MLLSGVFWALRAGRRWDDEVPESNGKFSPKQSESVQNNPSYRSIFTTVAKCGKSAQSEKA